MGLNSRTLQLEDEDIHGGDVGFLSTMEDQGILILLQDLKHTLGY